MVSNLTQLLISSCVFTFGMRLFCIARTEDSAHCSKGILRAEPYANSLLAWFDLIFLHCDPKFSDKQCR